MKPSRRVGLPMAAAGLVVSMASGVSILEAWPDARETGDRVVPAPQRSRLAQAVAHDAGRAEAAAPRGDRVPAIPARGVAIAAATAQAECPRMSEEGGSLTTAHRALVQSEPHCVAELQSTARLRAEFLQQGGPDAEGQALEWHLAQQVRTGGDGSVDPISVQCRATLCELVLMGYGDAAAQRWQEQLEVMRSQPWAGTVRGEHTALSTQGAQGTQQVLISYLILQ